MEPPGAEPCVAGVGATTWWRCTWGGRRWLPGLAVGVWVVVSLVAASNGGINSPNLLIYPVLIVCAAGCWQPLHHWFAGGHRRFVAIFLWADLHGALPAMRPHKPLGVCGVPGRHRGLTAATARKATSGGCMRPKPWPKT